MSATLGSGSSSGSQCRDDVRIVIIGAGFGGLLAALRLKKKLGFENFVIYEKGADVGGTWRDNTYPGCGCDVKSHWYSISSEPNAKWSKTFAGQPEIQQYIKNLVDQNDLRKHIQFNTRVHNAVWSESEQLYDIDLLSTTGNHWQDDSDNEKPRPPLVPIKAQAIISAIGGLHVPLIPDIKGIHTFAGPLFHSAEWRHDVDLKGKRIGIIGNGASACQIVPAISEDPTVNVVTFCRTPTWFVPRDQSNYSSLVQWVFANVPGVRAAYRSSIFVQSDLQWMAWRRSSAVIRRLAEAKMKRYIKQTAPKEMHDKLIPSYPLGCKRVIRDPGYLASLHRPNVSLRWDGIAEVVPDGIITKTGDHVKLDVLIPCTGFDVTSSLAPPIIGQHGQSAREYFESQGGPTAYRGTTLPGFPNVFVLRGPNVASGHASSLFVEECQVDYIIKMLRPMLVKGGQRRITSITVKSRPTENYNERIQERLKDTVWTACSSYYNQQGGRNGVTYPGFITQFWASMRSPKWEDYDIREAEVGEMEKL